MQTIDQYQSMTTTLYSAATFSTDIQLISLSVYLVLLGLLVKTSIDQVALSPGEFVPQMVSFLICGSSTELEQLHIHGVRVFGNGSFLPTIEPNGGILRLQEDDIAASIWNVMSGERMSSEEVVVGLWPSNFTDNITLSLDLRLESNYSHHHLSGRNSITFYFSSEENTSSAMMSTTTEKTKADTTSTAAGSYTTSTEWRTDTTTTADSIVVQNSDSSILHSKAGISTLASVCSLGTVAIVGIIVVIIIIVIITLRRHRKRMDATSPADISQAELANEETLADTSLNSTKSRHS